MTILAQATGFEDTMTTVGIWVAALLTLAIFSFLYKDNPVYKLAEHIFVGVAAGYTVAYTFWNVFVKNLWSPLVRGEIEPPAEGAWYWLHPDLWRWFLIIPAVLGIFFFTRFSAKLSWLSRWSIAFLVGAYAGVNLTGYFQSDLVIQTEATFVQLNPLTTPGGWNTVLLINLPILIGVLASLTYFFFSKPHTGFIGGTARLGIWFLMAAFGASFGYTVMARISLFIGRLQFLFHEWLHSFLHWPDPPVF
jgi:hypothetical protein